MLFRCPYCQRDTTLLPDRISSNTHSLGIDNADRFEYLYTEFRICPNVECKRASLTMSLAYRDTMLNQCQRRWR
jgi:hypothetical protein